jgi:hypothetical protein
MRGVLLALIEEAAGVAVAITAAVALILLFGN